MMSKLSLVIKMVALVVEVQAACDWLDIGQFGGKADFHSATLQWLAKTPARNSNCSFRIECCELQPWMSNRCRSQVIDNNDEEPAWADEMGGIRWRQFRTRVNGLRLATNYTFELITRSTGPALQQQRPRSTGHQITLQTKSFSAVSIECLANASRVQVETGPHFGGRISVDNSSCRVDGSASSNRTRYELVIDHRSCASFVNETSIVSYVVVQESASILTHTARRFVVVCKLVPDAYVVQSRLSMPLVKWDNESSNEIVGPPKHSQYVSDEQPRARNWPDVVSEPQLVIMVGLILAVVIGISAAVLFFILIRRRVVIPGTMCRSAGVTFPTWIYDSSRTEHGSMGSRMEMMTPQDFGSLDSICPCAGNGTFNAGHVTD